MSDVTEELAATRLRPDGRAIVWTAVVLVGILAGTSFALGIPGLLTVAAWAGLTAPLAWGVPVMLDGGLLTFCTVVTVRRGRGEDARLASVSLTVLTIASMAAQVAHVLATNDGVGWQRWAGAVLASAFPLTVLVSTHSLLDMAVAPRPRRGRAVRPTTKTAAPTVPTSASARAPRPTTAKPAPRPASGGRIPEPVRQQVLDLHAAGVSQRQIAARLDIDRKTVASILAVQTRRDTENERLFDEAEVA